MDYFLLYWRSGRGSSFHISQSEESVIFRCGESRWPASYWRSFTYDLTGNRLSSTDHATTPGGGDHTSTETYDGLDTQHAVPALPPHMWLDHLVRASNDNFDGTLMPGVRTLPSGQVCRAWAGVTRPIRRR